MSEQSLLLPSKFKYKSIPVYSSSVRSQEPDIAKQKSVQNLRNYSQQFVNGMPFTDIDLYLVHRNESRMRDIRNRKEMTVESTLNQASKLLRLAGRDVMNREPLPKTPPELQKRGDRNTERMRILPDHAYELAKKPRPIDPSNMPIMIPKGGTLANSSNITEKSMLKQISSQVTKRHRKANKPVKKVLPRQVEEKTYHPWPETKREAFRRTIDARIANVMGPNRFVAPRKRRGYVIRMNKLSCQEKYDYSSGEGSPIAEQQFFDTFTGQTTDEEMSTIFLTGTREHGSFSSALLTSPKASQVHGEKKEKMTKTRAIQILDTIDDVCLAELGASPDARQHLKRCYSQLELGHRRMQHHLSCPIPAKIFTEVEKRRHIQEFKDQKSCFVYGKDFDGHFHGTGQVMRGISKTTKAN